MESAYFVGRPHELSVMADGNTCGLRMDLKVHTVILLSDCAGKKLMKCMNAIFLSLLV